MKRYFSLFLCCLLVSCAAFSGGCGSTETGKLVICFDLGSGDETGQYQTAITGFLNWIDDCNKYLDFPVSSEDIEVDLIPGAEKEPAERAAALQRIRAELMAGKGPDVFIGYAFDYTLSFEDQIEGGRLFPYLESAMEKCFFLPLTDILSDLAYGDQTDFFPTIMDGGKNQAGEQVILPLSFAIPGMFFSGENAPRCDYEGLSWYDVLNSDDQVLLEQTVWALDYYKFASENQVRTGDHDTGLYCLFPQTADLENERLSFTEEELADLVKDSLDGYRRAMEQGAEDPIASLNFCIRNVIMNGTPLFMPNGNGPYTFVPLRNLEGGSTAVVESYFAANANTEKTEQITAVLDALLHPDYWHDGILTHYFSGMHNSQAFTAPGMQVHQGAPFSETLDTEWKRACADINIVRYPSPIDAELNSLMQDIEDSMFLCENPYSGIIQRDERILQGSITDEELRKIVSEHYQQMQHLLDES